MSKQMEPNLPFLTEKALNISVIVIALEEVVWRHLHGGRGFWL